MTGIQEETQNSNEINLIHLVLLVSFVELARCHDSWTLTRNTDADTCNKGLEDKLNALESQVKQLQKLIDQNDVSTYSTIDGIPRGSYQEEMLVIDLMEINKYNKL